MDLCCDATASRIRASLNEHLLPLTKGSSGQGFGPREMACRYWEWGIGAPGSLLPLFPDLRISAPSRGPA